MVSHAEMEEVARLVAWSRDKILKVRRLAIDGRVRRSLKVIAFSLHPRVNPRIRFLAEYDAAERIPTGSIDSRKEQRDGTERSSSDAH